LRIRDITLRTGFMEGYDANNRPTMQALREQRRPYLAIA
jgi:hypothetical protein